MRYDLKEKPSRTGLIAALLGLGIAAVLIAQRGLSPVGAALLSLGWAGLATIALFHLIPTALCGIAWRALVRFPSGNASLVFILTRWIRDGVGSVLAILPLSGEMVATRILALHGVSTDVAGASIVVDLTAELLSQSVLALLAIALLFLYEPHNSNIYWATGAMLIMMFAFLGFLAAQLKGLFRLVDRIAKPIARFWRQSMDASLHDAVLMIYRRPRALFASFMLHLLAWLMSVVEFWIALRFMGHPLALWQVLVVERLVFTFNAMVFIIPWNAGVQEGAYVLAGALFGLGSEVALALSLIRRGRDLILGMPAVLAWQLVEGGQAQARRWNRN